MIYIVDVPQMKYSFEDEDEELEDPDERISSMLRPANFFFLCVRVIKTSYLLSYVIVYITFYSADTRSKYST